MNQLSRTDVGPSLVVQARDLLAKASTVDYAKQIRDQAKAIAAYARDRGAGEEAVKYAMQARLWAERRIGELTRELPKATKAEAQAVGNPKRHGLTRDERPPVRTKQTALVEQGVSKKQAQRWEKLAAIPEAEFSRRLESLGDRAARAVSSERADPSVGGGVSRGPEYDSDEWWTPARFVDAARDVMGGIDLDPASCAEANVRVRAKRFYGRDEDGLALPWSGRVWLNPPYSQPAANLFARRLEEHIDGGTIEQAVMVQNASTDTEWFFRLASRCEVCLTRGRINFDRSDGASSSNRYGQVFFYYGANVKRFRLVFGCFGLVGKLEGDDDATVR